MIYSPQNNKNCNLILLFLYNNINNTKLYIFIDLYFCNNFIYRKLINFRNIS